MCMNENIDILIIGISGNFCFTILQLHVVETMNFKKGATIVKINLAVIDLIFLRILISHCVKIRIRKLYYLTGEYKGNFLTL
jgi:hypothetical protein